MSSSYYGGWFHKQEVVIPVNMTEEITMKLPMKSYMKGRAELINLSGILSFLVFSILAVTSFPSVGETLNWVEWRFVQSRLGIFGLALGVLHVYLMGMAYWIRKNSIITLMVSATFVSTLPAALVLFLKIVLSLPGIRGHLRRIRHGWERNGSKIDEESVAGLSNGAVSISLVKQV
jgi:predicted ferric reductase